MWNRISDLWCKKMHRRAMWPMHGKYICQQCLRQHAIKWEGPVAPSDYADPALRRTGLRMSSPVSVAQ